jgi:hypothetical protein
MTIKLCVENNPNTIAPEITTTDSGGKRGKESFIDIIDYTIIHVHSYFIFSAGSFYKPSSNVLCFIIVVSPLCTNL